MKTSKPAAKTTQRDRGEWGGMNWIRQDKRLAIYLRDGLACCYCGHSVESGASLSLDHVIPASKSNGSTDNSESNLVTACERCNKSRGNRSVKSFCRSVAGYINHGVTAKEIEDHVKACTKRPLKAHREEAKKMIARRGSAARVLADL